jgi:hypothetical protein
MNSSSAPCLPNIEIRHHHQKRIEKTQGLVVPFTTFVITVAVLFGNLWQDMRQRHWLATPHQQH